METGRYFGQVLNGNTGNLPLLWFSGHSGDGSMLGLDILEVFFNINDSMIPFDKQTSHQTNSLTQMPISSRQ